MPGSARTEPYDLNKLLAVDGSNTILHCRYGRRPHLRQIVKSDRQFFALLISQDSTKVLRAPKLQNVTAIDDLPMPVGRTVYVLDDDESVRRSLERLLRSAKFEPVTFKHPDAFLTAAKTIKAGCLLLDIRLQGMNGLEVQLHLNKIRRDLPVIVMTAQGDIQTAVHAMKAGAIDFLEKPYSDRALLSSIETAFATARQFDRNDEIADATRRIAALSPREREVFDGLMDGHSNKVIAYNLGLSVRTVEVHRARMMDRLGMRQLAEALRLGIISRLNTLPPAAKR
jgi:two-component system response regulator FixJ